MKALPSPEQTLGYRLYQYFQLTKPRVVSLIVFCAVIGMFLAVPGAVPPVVWLPPPPASPSSPAQRRR
jgi:protoheme IX farnesyltransferase